MTDWRWFVGSDEESYSEQFDTKEEAIECAKQEYEDGAYIIEAVQEPQALADFIHVDALLERAEAIAEELTNEDGDPLFEVTPEQSKSLETAIKTAVQKWQDDNKVMFIPFMFTQSRNGEFIKPEDAK